MYVSMYVSIATQNPHLTGLFSRAAAPPPKRVLFCERPGLRTAALELFGLMGYIGPTGQGKGAGDRRQRGQGRAAGVWGLGVQSFGGQQ